MSTSDDRNYYKKNVYSTPFGSYKLNYKIIAKEFARVMEVITLISHFLRVLLATDKFCLLFNFTLVRL